MAMGQHTMQVEEQRGYVEGPWGLMHYRKRGEGAPLLLVHQTPWSSVQYQNAVPLLAKDRTIISLDTPGYGASDTPPEPPSIPDYADAISKLLDGLSLECVDILGHHTGALIAGAFAARHKQRVNRLILHGAPVYDAAERSERLSKPHFDQTPQPNGTHFQNYWARLQGIIGPRADFSGLHASVLCFFTTGPKEWYGHAAAFQYDFTLDVPALPRPCLILSNSGDMLAQHAQRLQDLRPDFDRIEIPDGTSNIIYDEPKRWSQPIIDWLEKTES